MRVKGYGIIGIYARRRRNYAACCVISHRPNEGIPTAVNATEQLQDYFDRTSGSFDGIYTGEKSKIGRLWDQYARSNVHYRLEKTLRALHPITGKRVLDVGCGPGRYAVALTASGASEVVGLDISARMIERARILAGKLGSSTQCKFFQQEILKHTASEPYDAVVRLFDYVVQPEPVFARLRTLLSGYAGGFFSLELRRSRCATETLAYRGCRVRFFIRGEIMHLCERNRFYCKSLKRKCPIFVLIAESEDQSSC